MARQKRIAPQRHYLYDVGMGDSNVRIFHADCLADPQRGLVRPGRLAVKDGRIVDEDDAHGAEVVELPDCMLLPEMVNAHVHLDLTSVGPRRFDGAFAPWVRGIVDHRASEPSAVRASVAAGARQSLAAGVVAVGDILSAPEADFAGVAARANAGLGGTTFIELLGHGGERAAAHLARVEQAIDWARDHPDASIGLEPHAPYSTGPSLYDAAIASGLTVTTHLAEMIEELRFVAEAGGPMVELIRSRAGWGASWLEPFGEGLTPVQWLEPQLRRAAEAGRPMLVAHCNYVTDRDIEILAETGASVAYCPVASEYFGHPHAGRPGHRYRDMLDAGVNVCLGTDSIVCQPADEPHALGILPQIRRLHERDGMDPWQLLRMATVNGVHALRLRDGSGTFEIGAPTPMNAVHIDPHRSTDPLIQAMAPGVRLHPI